MVCVLFISCYQGICKHTTETALPCASALDLALLMGGATGGCEGGDCLPHFWDPGTYPRRGYRGYYEDDLPGD